MAAVASAIALGEHDHELDMIMQAASARRKDIAAAKRFELKRGDTVKFSDHIRPRYLIGLEATVAKVNQKSVVVDCPDDPAYGRFAGVRGVRCALTLIA